MMCACAGTSRYPWRYPAPPNWSLWQLDQTDDNSVKVNRQFNFLVLLFMYIPLQFVAVDVLFPPVCQLSKGMVFILLCKSVCLFLYIISCASCAFLCIGAVCQCNQIGNFLFLYDFVLK